MLHAKGEVFYLLIKWVMGSECSWTARLIMSSCGDDSLSLTFCFPIQFLVQLHDLINSALSLIALKRYINILVWTHSGIIKWILNRFCHSSLLEFHSFRSDIYFGIAVFLNTNVTFCKLMQCAVEHSFKTWNVHFYPPATKYIWMCEYLTYLVLHSI